MTQQNPKFNFRLIISAIFALLSLVIICLSLVNWQSVSLNLFSSPLNLPLGLFSLTAFLTGALTTWFVFFAIDKRKESIKTQVNWQSQDAKLIAEMVADKERLLQAKIDTLESALKTALKHQN
jgi:uncharacterized integral membrane protein